MDYAVDYWIEFWADFITALGDMRISDNVSLLGVLIGAIVIVVFISFAFSQKGGTKE